MACTCSGFIQNLVIRDCFPNGKAPANEFVFETLELYHSVSRDGTCKELKGIAEASLQHVVKMTSYFAKIKKWQKNF